MAQVSTFEIQMNAQPDRLWRAYRDFPNLLPQLMPDLVQSVRWIQGRGEAGSIREVRFGSDVSGITGHVSREVIDYVDHDDRIVSYHVYGGEFEESYNSYKVTTQISPSSYNASTLKYWVECEPIDGYSLFPMSSKTAFTAS